MRSIVIISALALSFIACFEKDQALPCNEITPGQLFEAKVDETWCLADESVKITVGPIVEDSRCNVTGIQCVWNGRAVVALTIDTKETGVYRDTLYAVNNWQDTLAIGSYDLFLEKVLPEVRTTTDVDTSKYSFQFILK